MKNLVLEYEILNWKKYNPGAKEGKACTWYRVNADMVDSPDCIRMDDKSFRIWHVLMSKSCRTQGCTRVALKSVCSSSCTRLKPVLSTLSFLQDSGMIRFSVLDQPPITALRTLRTVRNDTLRTNYMSKLEAVDSHRTVESLTKNPESDWKPEQDPEPKVDIPSPRKLAEIWNELTTEPIRKIDLKRLNADQRRWTWAKARLSANPDLSYWREVIEAINKTPFCRGDNKQGWTADFEFLVRKDTHAKVMEGKYSSQHAMAKKLDSDRESKLLAEMEQMLQDNPISRALRQ